MLPKYNGFKKQFPFSPFLESLHFLFKEIYSQKMLRNGKERNMALSTTSSSFALILVILFACISEYSANEVSTYAISCVRPYKKIGRQCLFFSRPFAPWGISESWAHAYLNFYDAAAMCRSHGGDLAASVDDLRAAQAHCGRLRGNCAPSMLYRDRKCFQWSPLEGAETQIPCNRWQIQMRYICEMKTKF